MQIVNGKSIVVGDREYTISDWDAKAVKRYDSPQSPPTPEELAYYKRVAASGTMQPRIFTEAEAKAHITQKANLLLQKFNKRFFCTEELKRLYVTLTLYFTNDQRFESLAPGLKLSKGLLLNGPRGIGKTFALGLFTNDSISQNPQFYNAPTSNNFVNCASLLRLYKRDGESVIIRHTDENAITVNGNTIYPTVTYDELSEVTTGKNFGNETNVMREILEGRYDNFVRHGQITHLTTNIQSEANMIDLFGERLHDRIKEMFNIIPVTGVSLR